MSLVRSKPERVLQHSSSATSSSSAVDEGYISAQLGHLHYTNYLWQYLCNVLLEKDYQITYKAIPAWKHQQWKGNG